MKYCLADCDENARRLLSSASELAGFLFQEDGVRLTLSREQSDGYRITYGEDGCRIAYRTLPQLCRALLYAVTNEACENVSERCAFSDFGIMLDVSRNAVLNPETLKKMIRYAAYLGYGFVGLYMEDTIRVNEEPYFGYMRGALSETELAEADAYAAVFGIELRPFIQTLAHLNQIVRYEEYERITDTDDILLAGDPRTRELLEHLIGAVSKSFTSRKINIGMDEAHMVGLGKYLDRHGYEERQQIMEKHLEMVLEICRKYGFQVQMWSDMFFRLAFHGEYYTGDDSSLECIHIPEGVQLGYWDYYSTDREHYAEMLRRHKKLAKDVAFVGGAWKWTGFVPHNRYSIRAGEAALTACRENGIDSVTLTCWGDDGAETSVFSVLPAFFADAQLSYDSTMNENAFRLLTGFSLQEFLQLDDVNPYSSGETHNNASKYLLYNDPLIGTFDSVLRPDTPEQFAEAAGKLKKLTKRGSFSYIMETAYRLCLVLEKKAALGREIREAYEAQNTEALRWLADFEIPEILKRSEDFYESFRAQWEQENKSFGFEVQTVRIGGLLQRLKDVRRILNSYLDGTIDRIAELEEKQKPFHYFEENEIESLNYNLWRDIVSPSRI